MITACVQMDVTCAGHYVGAAHWIPSGHHKLWLYDARNVHRFCMMCQVSIFNVLPMAILCRRLWWPGGCRIRGNNVVCRSFNRLRVACSCLMCSCQESSIRNKRKMCITVALQSARIIWRLESNETFKWKYYYRINVLVHRSSGNALFVGQCTCESSTWRMLCWSMLLGVWYLFCH